MENTSNTRRRKSRRGNLNKVHALLEYRFRDMPRPVSLPSPPPVLLPRLVPASFYPQKYPPPSPPPQRLFRPLRKSEGISPNREHHQSLEGKEHTSRDYPPPLSRMGKYITTHDTAYQCFISTLSSSIPSREQYRLRIRPYLTPLTSSTYTLYKKSDQR